MIHFKKFDKKDKSSFSYWFWHWLAYNYTAIKLHVWKPKYILHDMEKPWFKLMWRDYQRVKKWHRAHSSHHTAYARIHGWDKMDWLGGIVDWECSRLTKNACQLNARQEVDYMTSASNTHFTQNEKEIIKKNCYPILDELGL